MSDVSYSTNPSGRSVTQPAKTGRYVVTSSTGKKVYTASRTDQRALQAAARTVKSVDQLLENRRASAKR